MCVIIKYYYERKRLKKHFNYLQSQINSLSDNEHSPDADVMEVFYISKIWMYIDEHDLHKYTNIECVSHAIYMLPQHISKVERMISSVDEETKILRDLDNLKKVMEKFN